MEWGSTLLPFLCPQLALPRIPLQWKPHGSHCRGVSVPSHSVGFLESSVNAPPLLLPQFSTCKGDRCPTCQGALRLGGGAGWEAPSRGLPRACKQANSFSFVCGKVDTVALLTKPLCFETLRQKQQVWFTEFPKQAQFQNYCCYSSPYTFFFFRAHSLKLAAMFSFSLLVLTKVT